METTAPPGSVLQDPSPTTDVKLSSPHVDDDSLCMIISHSKPDLVDQRYKSLSKYWRNPSFDVVGLQIDGKKLLITRAKAVELPNREEIIVREEHLAIWASLQAWAVSLAEVPDGRFDGVLWGQPGAGKSYSLYVFAAICMEKGIPVALFQLGSELATLVIVVTTQDGQGNKTSAPRTFTVPIGLLPDITFNTRNYQFNVKSKLPKSTVLLATSLQKVRYDEWAKQLEVLFATTQLFSREEILAAYGAQGLASDQIVSFDAMPAPLPSGYPQGGYSAEQEEQDCRADYQRRASGAVNDEWSPLVVLHTIGPNARACLGRKARLRRSNDPLRDLLPHSPQALRNFEKPLNVFSFLRGIDHTPDPSDMGLFYHRFFIESPILPADGTSSFSRFAKEPQYTTDIATSGVRTLLQGYIAEGLKKKQFELLSLVEDGPGQLRGLVYESAAKYALSSKGTATFHTLSHLTPSVDLALHPANPPLSSSHTLPVWDPNNQQLPAPTTPRYYDFPPRFPSADGFLVTTTTSNPSSLPPRRALRFLAKQISAITHHSPHYDVAVQVTVAQKHPVKEEGVRLIRKAVQRRTESLGGKLVYAFVVPSMEDGRRLAKKAGRIQGFDKVGWIVVNNELYG